MSSRAAGVIALAAVACGSSAPPPPRERVLARLPAGLLGVLAADGPTLSHPRTRATIDVLRPRWPARLGCAIDAALAADHVAVGVTSERSAVLVLETQTVPSCDALSKIADRTYVATLGSAKPRSADAPSLLDDPRFVRARRYLATAPAAIAVDVPGGSAIATATPEPLDAWLALDVQPLLADVVEARVRDQVEALARDARTRDLAIDVTREGTQIVARLGGTEATRATLDVPAIVRIVLAGR